MKVKELLNAPNLFLIPVKTLSLLFVLIAFGLNSSMAQNDNANENATVYGGDIKFADDSHSVDLCVGNEDPDFVDVIIENASGRLKQWIITDDQDKILGLPNHPSEVDFDGAGEGTCRIYHVSYNGMKPLVIPFRHKHLVYLSDLRGKFHLSNYLEVNRIQEPEAGKTQIVGGGTEIEICSGDGTSDAFDVEFVEDSEGGTPQWIITDDQGKILGLPAGPPFDLEGAPEGTCLVWYLRYEWIDGLELGLNAFDLTGCYDLSNEITVIRNEVNGGSIYLDDMTTEATICAGDGVSDSMNVNVSDDVAPGPTAWVITDDAGIILDLPGGPPFDLEGAGEGVCLIWHLSYEDGLQGAEVGSNANELAGCYDLSNPITITRNGVNAGNIYLDDMTTEATICAGDGVSDSMNVNVSDDVAPGPTAWVITDDTGIILDLPAGPPFDLEGAGEGVCLIWYLSYEDGLEGAEVGSNANDLAGCYDLSNPITITRNGVNGGTLEGGPFEFTVGDNTADNIAEDAITLSGNIGTNSAWVVTDEAGETILGLPDNYTDVDFDSSGAGTCKIWHLSYEDGLIGLEVAGEGEDPKLVEDLEGCFSFSNAVDVVRTAAAGRASLVPNPSKGLVSIALSSKAEDLNVEVYNLQNAKILNKRYSSRSLQGATPTIDVSRYVDGLYLVKITDRTSGESYLKRLVVKK